MIFLATLALLFAPQSIGATGGAPSEEHPTGVCGDDNIGSVPDDWHEGTVVLLTTDPGMVPGTTWWSNDGSGCVLRGWIATVEGIQSWVATGVYHEPSWGTDETGTPSTPPFMESTWTSGGVSHRVVTPKGASDSTESWAQKHKKHVDVMQSVFPPDPPHSKADESEMRRWFDRAWKQSDRVPDCFLSTEPAYTG